MTLKEFLREQADAVRSHEATKEVKLQAWISAVSKLVDQIQGWLTDSDQEKLLRVDRIEIQLSEESLGPYLVPALRIWLGGRSVNVEPVALEVVGPSPRKSARGRYQGRVNVASRLESFSLYRFVGEDGRESWEIIDPRNFTRAELTQATFEAALVSLF